MSFLAARSEAAQTQFVRDEELRFRISTKRDRMLGRWAGEMLGHDGEALEAYIDKIVHAALMRPNGGLHMIAMDFRQSRLSLAVTELPKKAEEYLNVAERILSAA
jgi:hypothetical protein